MIEHEPWRGPDCKRGIEGQRIAIVGYSHHRDPNHEDNNLFTNCVLERVASGEKIRDSLFPRVPGYFGFENSAEFWRRVWFFNFIPECIGTSDMKYGVASPDLIGRAKERFTRILRTERPSIQKVFVFTTKGWSSCPDTVVEGRGGVCLRLGPQFDKVTWGEYRFGSRTVLAFGLRHPQFANRDDMTAAVSEALTRHA